jgi:predicted ATPase
LFGYNPGIGIQAGTFKGMIRRVRIKNYRSLANVAVDLADFTILVGPNGAGKSNFVDALSFVADCLNTPIDSALHKRGGINAVRRKSSGHPVNFGVSIEFDFPQKWRGPARKRGPESGAGLRSASYAFEIKAEKEAKYTVKKERCRIWGLGEPEITLDAESGKVTIETPDLETFQRTIEDDRLALQIFSGFPQLRPVYDFLSTMRFYSLVPDHIRRPQEVDPGKWLERDGANAAAVLRNIINEGGSDHERICSLLSKAVPGVTEVSPRALGQFETMVFRQEVKGAQHAWEFDTYNMSDGTLRILGILLAVHQRPSPSCLFIEEPEATVHPAAADIVVDILQVARKRAQVVVTTHSPDILDNKNLKDEQIRYVENDKGITSITPIDPLSRDLVRQRLYSIGELLREDKLKPDRSPRYRTGETLDLFSREQR